MNKIDVNYNIRIVTFDSDGIYTVGQSTNSDSNYFEISDTELTTLVNNINKITLPQIVDNDVIYFEKDATFPKLLLGRLDLKVKRTIKSDKCTKIVVNEDSILTSSQLNLLEHGYLIFVGGKDESDYNQVFYISQTNIDKYKEFGLTLDLMQRYFPGTWKKVTSIPEKITLSSLELMNSVPEKITTVQNVALYLNSQLSPLDSDSAKTMISLFRAGNEEKKLAVNMIASFNISSILFDICEAIGTGTGYFDNSTKSSINYKYFRLLLGVNPSDIQLSWRYGYYYSRRTVCKVFNNPLISPDQKLKAWNFFNKSVEESSYDSANSERKRSVFNQYNMPLNYDPRGETSTSNSEVEGK